MRENSLEKSNIRPVLTVTLNPAIDKYMEIDGFRAGHETIVNKVVMSAGGKGINVSRVLNALGFPTRACGFAGGSNGQKLLRELLLEGIEHHFVFIQAETRTNLTIHNIKSKQVTRIIEAGPPIEPKDVQSFHGRFARLSAQSDWVVLSGSGVKGLRKDFYCDLVKTAQSHNAKVIVDASKENLKAALKARPFLVKPNLEEAQDLLQKPLTKAKDFKSALKAILSMGVQNAILSLGAKGALACDGRSFYCVSVPKVTVVNAVGSGDALIAGFLSACVQNKSFAQALAYGAAVATANCCSVVPGKVHRAGVATLLKQVRVKTF